MPRETTFVWAIAAAWLAFCSPLIAVLLQFGPWIYFEITFSAAWATATSYAFLKNRSQAWPAAVAAPFALFWPLT